MSTTGRRRLRPGPLRAAAGLAALFVAARIAYRVLFDGASGTGAVLLPLPAIPLPAPFSWVVLLGPVTLDGLWDAVWSAVPVASVILMFGVLNATFDVSRAFTRLARRGPLRGVARALAVAWSTLPALGAAVRTVHTAQRLRGEKPGPRMLVPVLERTLERATAVACGMELRGFGAAGTADDGLHATGVHESGVRAQHGDDAGREHADARPVALRDASFGFGVHEVLRVDDLALCGGTLTVLTGPTGSGKSTLLRALAGLLDHVDGGWSAGAVSVAGRGRRGMAPRDTARLVGAVLQNPREGFCSELVRDEVGLALQLRGAAQATVEARVHDVAARIGITALLDRSVHTLSAGEATLVAIAAAVVERPVLLLADEPLADLDTSARERIVRVLDALAHHDGACVLVAEHRAASFDETADAWCRIDAGVLHPGREIDIPESVYTRPESRCDRPAPHEAALAASHVHVAHGEVVAVRDATVSLARGEIAALIGPNGAGKSSLLVALALPPRGVTVAGNPVLVPDASDDLFTRDSVAAECGRADHLTKRMAGRVARRIARRALPAEPGSTAPGTITPGSAPPGSTDPGSTTPGSTTPGSTTPASTADRFAEFLGLDACARADLTRRHPRDLSLGERRCLAIALQLSRSPDALLIDEPTRGLDAAARTQVRSALRRVADAGTAVLVATHDADFAAALGARIIPMRHGLVAAAAPETVPSPAHANAARASAQPLSAIPSPGGGGSPAPPSRIQPESSPHALHPRTDAVPAPVRVTRAGSDTSRYSRAPRDTSRHPRASRDTPRHPRASRDTPRRPRARPPRPTRRRLAPVALAIANLVAVAAFTWPLAAAALPAQAQSAAPWAALAVAPIAVIVAITALDESVRSAHSLAYLGVLAAIGAAVRIASTGVGGVEAVFVLLVLAGRAFGARFGMLLGVATILLSSTLFGGFGPWTPFQMFACAWVGAGAGLLPRRVRGWAEIGMLCLYGAAASYVFGLLMNIWFWPFAVGSGAAISYVPGAPLTRNLGSFLLYSLVTSTAGWDTLRAVTTIIGVTVIGAPVLASLRRAKPVVAYVPERARTVAR